MRSWPGSSKEDRCETCGISEWLGRPLSLALHHVNGVGDDNRLENLQLLCPNCHSQTDNFGGRNRQRKMVKILPHPSGAALLFGVVEAPPEHPEVFGRVPQVRTARAAPDGGSRK